MCDRLYGPEYVQDGWKPLSIFNRNNWANSMINDRNNDNKLAENQDGSGVEYCADSNSNDSRFSDNPIGNDDASAFKITGGDQYC